MNQYPKIDELLNSENPLGYEPAGTARLVGSITIGGDFCTVGGPSTSAEHDPDMVPVQTFETE